MADRGVAEVREAWAQGVARRQGAGNARGMMRANVKAGRRRVSAAEACLRSYVPPMSVPQEVAPPTSLFHERAASFGCILGTFILAHPEKQVVQPWARRVLIRVDHGLVVRSSGAAGTGEAQGRAHRGSGKGCPHVGQPV